MKEENNEIFAYSKDMNTYLQMLKTGNCAVAVENGKIIASLLTRPEDNRDGILDLADVPPIPMSDTI